MSLLLSKILAHPNDNQARLDYANTIGNPYRAKLIKLQLTMELVREKEQCKECQRNHQLYLHNPKPIFCKCSCFWLKLIDEEDVLLHLHGHEMFNEHPNFRLGRLEQKVPTQLLISFPKSRFGGCYDVKIERGFLSQVRLSLRPWLDYGADICTLHPITEIIIWHQKPARTNNKAHWWFTNKPESPIELPMSLAKYFRVFAENETRLNDAIIMDFPNTEMAETLLKLIALNTVKYGRSSV